MWIGYSFWTAPGELDTSLNRAETPSVDERYIFMGLLRLPPRTPVPA